jgi:hypothetical protein
MTQAPKNVVASVLARLRNVAQEAGLSFNDILQSYVIERFSGAARAISPCRTERDPATLDMKTSNRVSVFIPTADRFEGGEHACFSSGRRPSLKVWGDIPHTWQAQDTSRKAQSVRVCPRNISAALLD